MRATTVAIAILALSQPGATQGAIWTVDSAGRTGSQFTEITAAIAKAAPGDRIVVRAGLYRPFVVDKGVSILGEPGALVGVPSIPWYIRILIQDLPSGSELAISGLTMATSVPLSIQSPITVARCAGRVHLQGLGSSTPTAGMTLRIVDSEQVDLTDVAGWRLYVTRSTVNMNACRFTATPAHAGLGMVFEDSRVFMAGCTASGPTRAIPFVGSAISVVGKSSLTITGDGRGSIQAGPFMPSPAIVGDGTLILDPRVAVSATGWPAPIIWRGQQTVRPVPYLTVSGGQLGGVARGTLQAGSQQLYVLGLGEPSAPNELPGIQGSVWLDLRTTWAFSVGVLSTRGEVRFSMPVPNDLGLLGAQFAWQGLSGSTIDCLSNSVGLTLFR